MDSLYDIIKKWEIFTTNKIKRINNSCVTKESSFSLNLERDEECKRVCLTNQSYHLTDKTCKGCKTLSLLYRVPIVTNSKAALFFQEEKEKNEIEDDVEYERNILFDRYDKRDYTMEERNYCYCEKHKYVGNDKYILNDESKNYINTYLSYVNTKYLFEIKKVDYSYTTDSRIINYITVSLIMDSIMKRKGFTHNPPFIWAYICNEDINLVERTFNMGHGSFDFIKKNKSYITSSSPTANGSVHKINKNTCVNIVKQLISILSFLSDYHFNHGDPSIKYINFESKKEDETEKIEIKDVVYDINLKLTIKPSMYSSISYKSDKGIYYNFRYCSSNSSPIFNNLPIESFFIYLLPSSTNDKRMKENHFVKSDIPYIEEYSERRYFVYKIGRKSSDFKKVFKDNGIPIFCKSFNFVCFLVSLLKETFFYESFFRNKSLQNIWNNVWSPSDSSFILERLKDDTENTFEVIFDFMTEVYIRMDIQEYFLEALSSM
jgi:hypothetical protein